MWKLPILFFDVIYVFLLCMCLFDRLVLKGLFVFIVLQYVLYNI
jgi:hypothetical protein